MHRVLPISADLTSFNRQNLLNTSLSLLIREGALVVTFASLLTAEQYVLLYDSVRDAESKAEMTERLSRFATETGVAMIVEE